MKNIIFILLLLPSTLLFSQYSQLKFSEATFENGMLYPILTSPGLPEVSDRINAHLQKQIEDLKASDFCVGQFGYVQKAFIVQVHIFCNCIDFSESQNRYYLYNVDSGKAEDNMGLINEKKEKKFASYILNKTKTFASRNNIELNENQLTNLKTENLNAFKMILSKDGVNLWLEENWGDKPMFISWGEISEFQ